MTVTISNLMKGLSIFAMRPLTDEEISSYNDYDENLEIALSTTVRDVAGRIRKKEASRARNVHRAPGIFEGFYEHFVRTVRKSVPTWSRHAHLHQKTAKDVLVSSQGYGQTDDWGHNVGHTGRIQTFFQQFRQRENG